MEASTAPLTPFDFIPTRNKRVPKGSVDVALDRLFPERLSEVPIDHERRDAVFAILLENGVIQDADG